ncbi:hypothetical protein ElyMa_006154900 [Elysia marginata]|uniref:Uncharacterized protein n=1 Tax=Elysia marginata TaxID=1093978 RepID=A0AAV4GZ12_9GAST|nr:hypothetical protein ElyMa_006154900 [Elysia marginata]
MCHPFVEDKKKREKRAAQATGGGQTTTKSTGSTKKLPSGLMCSKMQQTFTDLKKTLNRRVEVQILPLFYVMIVATLVILCVGFVQMVSDFQREMYVRKWERENILQPLQIRAREQEEELKKAIQDEQGEDVAQKKRCTIS